MERIERWMEIHKVERIYEFGSLPLHLLVFARHVAAIEHRWNQHGLGGDNVKGSCRHLRAARVSLLHFGLVVVNHGRDLIQETLVILMLFGNLLICMDIDVDMNHTSLNYDYFCCLIFYVPL